jgi:hypothetical protein
VYVSGSLIGARSDIRVGLGLSDFGQVLVRIQLRLGIGSEFVCLILPR